MKNRNFVITRKKLILLKLLNLLRYEKNLIDIRKFSVKFLELLGQFTELPQNLS